MTLNSDTLNPGGTGVPPQPSSPASPPPAPPATPPGQQTGSQGQSGTQAPPPPTGPAPGQQSGASGGSDDTTVNLPKSKEDFEARIDKAKRSGVRELLAALGFEGLDDPTKLGQAQTDIGDLITYAREQKRAQMTAEEKVKADLETAQSTARDEIAKRETAEKERDAAQHQLREYILRSAVTQAAQGAAHPSDVYDLYARVYAQDKLADVIKADKPLFTDDGLFNADVINAEAVKAIIDKCREDRREWWQGGIRGIGSPSNAGAQPPAGDITKLEQQRELARANLRRA